MNISDLLPCAGQGEKRSGILIDLASWSFSLPAPCDCYDDVVISIPFPTQIGRAISKRIVKYAPRLARPFRVDKAKTILGDTKINLNKRRQDLKDYVNKHTKYGVNINQINANFLEEMKALKNQAKQAYKACLAVLDPPWPSNTQVVPPQCQNSWNELARLYNAVKLIENSLADPNFPALKAKYKDGIKSQIGKILKKEKEIRDLEDLIQDPGGDIAWADKADALLSSLDADYWVELIDFGLTLIGLFSFVQKHVCRDESMLDPETCKCTRCSAAEGGPGGQLCENDSDWPTWLPEAPGMEVNDEQNSCKQCCGGSILVKRPIPGSGIFGPVMGCFCDCPEGMIKRPCKRKPEGMGCNPMLPFSGGLDCVDTCGDNQTDGQAAGICAPETPPTGLVWSDTDCDFVDNSCDRGTISESLGNCESKNSITTIINNCGCDAVFTLTGAVNDEVLIDGQIFEPGKYPFPWEEYSPGPGEVECWGSAGENGAHEFTYSRNLGPSESVTIGAKDTCCGGGLEATWTITCKNQ